jgi:membrane protein YdbS with pleckstrin-like domain
MTIAIAPLTPLEPGQKAVFRIRAAILWTVVLAAVVAAELLLRPFDWPPGIFAALALAVWIWRVLIVPPRRWRASGYAFTGSELHVAQGVLVETYTIVPVVRVQHIDINQGPVERAWRLCSLALHTAGSEANVVVLPGITRETAEAIRDSIRRTIGSVAE